MSEEEFWLKMVSRALAALVLLAFVAAGCCAYKTEKIAKLVSDGSDPIKARCAVIGFERSSSAAVCARFTEGE